MSDTGTRRPGSGAMLSPGELQVSFHRVRRAWSPRVGALAAVLGLALALPADAQRTQPEFVRQGLLVPGFIVDSGIDARAAGRAGDAARTAARRLSNGRDVEVIGTSIIRSSMEAAGFRPTDAWSESSIRALGMHTRADEYLMGRVEREGRSAGQARVTGELVLMRDRRLRQPLPPATAAELDAAAEQLGASLIEARVQMPHLRRCENGLRLGENDDALRAARAGVAAYPRSTLARTCLVWALRATGASPSEILEAAQAILAIDSSSFHALEGAALALDSLRRPRESAPYWLRLAASDSANVELAERVLHALYEGRSLEPAERLAVQRAGAFPEHLPFVRHQWRISFDRQSWPVAIAAGEMLLARDSAAAHDAVFFRRLATAYRSAGQPFKAVETVARGVSRFPDDSRLYALYAQFVMAEADTVLPRGLARFPRDGELLALHAQHLRAGGKLADAVNAMREAIAVGSTVPDAALMLAQAEMELGRPDSALASLRHALATGRDSTRLAQFAFARGNALYRAAQGTRTSSDHALALGFLALADSVRPSAQTKLMLGMAALGAAQASFTEATSERDQARRCSLVQHAAAMLPVARASLEFGRDVAAEAVDQGMTYLDQLEPYSATAIKGYCGGG